MWAYNITYKQVRKLEGKLQTLEQQTSRLLSTSQVKNMKLPKVKFLNFQSREIEA